MHHVLIREHLIDEVLLDVDAPRIAPGQVTHELLVARWWVNDLSSQSLDLSHDARYSALNKRLSTK